MRFAWSVPLGLFVICTGGAFSSEIVHLRSGFELEAISHKASDRGYSFETPTGTIDLPKSEVVDIESTPDLEPAPAPTSAVVPPVDLNSLIESVAISVANTPEFSRLVRSVANVESHLQRSVRSSKGATGIMQLMPDTAREMGVAIGDSVGNIKGGSLYLKQLLVQYHNDAVLALAAYNAGPGAVQKYGGVPPFLETRTYIRKVLAQYSLLQRSEAPSK
jgi:hypothetical protein